jgi:hypothetical protein
LRADDEWIYIVDNKFAKGFFEKCGTMNLPGYSYNVDLCNRCSNVKLSDDFSKSELRQKIRPCIICRMQSRRSQDVNERTQILNSQSKLRICAAPKTKGGHRDIQIGFPKLPEAESSIRFELFREWLRVCDENHHECDLKHVTELPTRVVDVGRLDNSKLHLHVFKPDDRGDYIALSHCWGILPEEQRRMYCTGKNNIEERVAQGFDVGILPQTFQDAVTVTRKLGKQYLWIDSLCIIQYDDDYEDWKKECKKMESVFRNAYCTIAATSAEDSTKGFLKRRIVDHPEAPYIKVPTSSHGSLYVSALADDFQQDVENGVLNQRAWVLQERALSRRTIHFTSNQTYWECGEGVRCETLTYMRNSKSLFLGDAKFPLSLNMRAAQDRIRLFQFLFTRYSHLGLTESKDRPVAISGLEQRLADTFKTTCRYGVFEKYLHRSLLWMRPGSKRRDRVEYQEDKKVPSWSWMAVDGVIEYMDVESEGVEWSEGVRMEKKMLKAQVRYFKNCRVERGDDGVVLLVGKEGGTEGWVKYDGRRRSSLRTVGCVVVGREKRWSDGLHFVLVVARKDKDGGKEFRRVGVGSVPKSFIDFGGGKVEECIV